MEDIPVDDQVMPHQTQGGGGGGGSTDKVEKLMSQLIPHLEATRSQSIIT